MIHTLLYSASTATQIDRFMGAHTHLFTVQMHTYTQTSKAQVHSQTRHIPAHHQHIPIHISAKWQSRKNCTYTCTRLLRTQIWSSTLNLPVCSGRIGINFTCTIAKKVGVEMWLDPSLPRVAHINTKSKLESWKSFKLSKKKSVVYTTVS